MEIDTDDPQAPSLDMASFKLLYEGEQHDIDADVLLTSVGTVTDLVGEINEEFGDDRDLKIRISAPERGSFGIDLGLLADAAETIMRAEEEIKYTAAVITILVGLFRLREFLGSESPESVERDRGTVRVERPDGTVLEIDSEVADLYFNEDEVEVQLRNHFQNLQEDERIEGFTIEDPETGQERFHVDREEFERLAGEEDEEPETRRISDRVGVTVVRIVFDQDRRWEFLYQGDSISAKIEDLGFWARVDHREESFQKGDRLEVELERQQEFDPTINDWRTVDHKVTEVYGHDPRPEQGDMFDSPD